MARKIVDNDQTFLGHSPNGMNSLRIMNLSHFSHYSKKANSEKQFTVLSLKHLNIAHGTSEVWEKLFQIK